MASKEKDNTKEPEFNSVDVKFVFECLKNLDKERMVDLPAVAASLGYTNVASVYNRLRALRKKYGIENLEGKMTGTVAKSATGKEDKDNNTSSDATVEEEPKAKRKRGNTQSAKGFSKPASAAKGARAGKGSKRGKPKQEDGIDDALLAAVDVAAEDA
ncbi:hypothetical protein HFD88_009542 [Aspergillus terreus]|nr:hypothetical protein HFD88_009542 [Aspergillus terreus]